MDTQPRLINGVSHYYQLQIVMLNNAYRCHAMHREVYLEELDRIHQLSHDLNVHCITLQDNHQQGQLDNICDEEFKALLGRFGISDS